MTDISKEDLPKYYNALEVADKRAFPVNMAAAIETLSLNDAAMIGYLRGINDAAITLKRKRQYQSKETDVVEVPVLAIDKGPSGDVLSISVAEANPDGSFKYTHFFEGKNAEFVASLTSEITALRERVAELEGPCAMWLRRVSKNG